MLLIGKMEAEDVVKNLRVSDPSEPFWEEPFRMSRQMAGNLYRSLRGSLGRFVFFHLFLTVCLCE